MTKSSSGFSCHLIKTSDGCTAKQSAQALTQVFAFVKAQTNNISNQTTLASTNVIVNNIFNVTEEFADTSIINDPYIFVYMSSVITLATQIYS